MSRFVTDLTGLPPQFEVRSEAEKWKGAQQATQTVMREQGQVMSAALTNNRSLWETNKALRARCDVLLELSQRLERERNDFKRALDAIPTETLDMAALKEENDALRRSNAVLVKELTASMHPELDTEARKAELARVKAQEAEIQALGIVPTPQDIAKADHARDSQGDAFAFDPVQVRPTGA